MPESPRSGGHIEGDGEGDGEGAAALLSHGKTGKAGET